MPLVKMDKHNVLNSNSRAIYPFDLHIPKRKIDLF